MAYTKHDWSVGDIITIGDLDRIESALESLSNSDDFMKIEINTMLTRDAFFQNIIGGKADYYNPMSWRENDPEKPNLHNRVTSLENNALNVKVENKTLYIESN